MVQLPVYLDNNATTPCDSRVVEAMLPYFTGRFGNAASRTHAYGWEAAEAVDIAREELAALIGCETSEIVFTSGATESDNLAIKGVFELFGGAAGNAGTGGDPAAGRHIITVATEHKAVLDTCGHIEKLGGRVSYLPVDAAGLIDLAALEAAIQPDTILISVMLANNETGVIQPIQAIGEIARQRGVLLFCDAAQAVGKIPIDLRSMPIDMMAISAHKLYGPKGVGALYLRRRDPRVRLIAQMDGGGHEKGRRSGTLNVPGIVGLGRAAALCRETLSDESVRLGSLRDRLEAGLLALGHCQVNGSREHRLPHTTNMSFSGSGGQGLLGRVQAEIALSSGSACTSASTGPSYVLKAMGVEDGLAQASLRFGLGRFTTEAEVEFVLGRMAAGLSVKS